MEELQDLKTFDEIPKEISLGIPQETLGNKIPQAWSRRIPEVDFGEM